MASPDYSSLPRFIEPNVAQPPIGAPGSGDNPAQQPTQDSLEIPSNPNVQPKPSSRPPIVAQDEPKPNQGPGVQPRPAMGTPLQRYSRPQAGAKPPAIVCPPEERVETGARNNVQRQNQENPASVPQSQDAGEQYVQFSKANPGAEDEVVYVQLPQRQNEPGAPLQETVNLADQSPESLSVPLAQTGQYVQITKVTSESPTGAEGAAKASKGSGGRRFFMRGLRGIASGIKKVPGAMGKCRAALARVGKNPMKQPSGTAEPLFPPPQASTDEVKASPTRSSPGPTGADQYVRFSDVAGASQEGASMSPEAVALRHELMDSASKLDELQRKYKRKGSPQVSDFLGHYINFLKHENYNQRIQEATEILIQLEEQSSERLYSDLSVQTDRYVELSGLTEGSRGAGNISEMEQLLDSIFNDIVTNYKLGEE